MKKTADWKLIYWKRNAQLTEACTARVVTDTDWAENCDKKSFMGIIVYFCECPVAWVSTKQSIQALSTMEAEFIGGAEGAKWYLYLENLLEGVVELESPARIEGDNKSATEFAKNAGCNMRTKHISVRYYFLKELLALGRLLLEHIPGITNVADLLTKGLPGPRTEALARYLLGHYASVEEAFSAHGVPLDG